MADPFASAFEPAFAPPPAANFSPRPSISGISGFPVAPNQVLAVWSVTAPEKAKSDQIFLSIDTDQDGLVNGGECKPIFLQSGLPPPMLAHIWTLCDIRKNGVLNSEQFALAFHLIHQKVKSNTDPPTSLSPDLVPPSMRSYSTQFPIPGLTGGGEDDLDEGGDEELRKEIKALEEEIRGIKADKAQLVQEVEGRRAEVQARQTELHTMAKEFEQLQAAVKQLDFQRGEAQKRLDDLDAQKTRLLTARSTLTAEIQAERDKSREIRSEIERRQRGHQDEEAEVSQKKAELERLKREEMMLAQTLESQRAQMASLESAVREGDGRLAQIEQHMGRVSSLNTTLKEAISQFDAALTSQDTSTIDRAFLDKPLSDFTFNAGMINFDPIAAVATFPKPITGSTMHPTFDDPFSGEDPFAQAPASVVGDDPWGASPFGFTADPFAGGFPPESPLPALPPKKTALPQMGGGKQAPPPRPAPPKAGKKEGASPARDAFEDPWGAPAGGSEMYAFPGFEQPKTSTFATDFDDFGKF